MLTVFAHCHVLRSLLATEGRCCSVCCRFYVFTSVCVCMFMCLCVCVCVCVLCLYAECVMSLTLSCLAGDGLVEAGAGPVSPCLKDITLGNIQIQTSAPPAHNTLSTHAAITYLLSIFIALKYLQCHFYNATEGQGL